MQKSISLIGGGRLATNLGRLWAMSGMLSIRDVLCRSLSDSRRAVGLIGAGRPLTEFNDLRNADIFVIATPDRAIASVAGRLATTGCVAESCVVFHCSGAESSRLLEAVRVLGAATASAHPLMTFSEKLISAEKFAGTYCAIEGDARACVLIDEILAEIGARTIAISTDQKLLYHAAAVFASNYLITLFQIAMDTHRLLGVQSDLSREILAPLVRRSIENAIMTGPRDAMTGPIVRGDVELVQRQFAAISASDHTIAELYLTLATHTARVMNVPNPLAVKS